MIRRLFAFVRTFRFMPLALAGCLVFAGCATNTAGLSPEQQALEQSHRRFFTTTATGTLVGAAGGALLGGLLGGGRGALIGAAAGGVAGTAAGYAVAQNNYSKSQTEGNLNAAIQDANQKAGQARDDAQTAQQVAAQARARAAQLRGQYRAGQITAAQYRSSLASYQSSLNSLQDLSRAYGESISEMRQNAATARGRDGGALNASSSSIVSSKATLDGAVSDLRATLAAEPT